MRSEKPADLVIINGPEPETLDPAFVTGEADMRAALSIFEGLTRLNARTAKPEPGLADHWTISADGTVYTFFIRPNARWSTGEPITAPDVYYSWMRALNPAAGADYAGQLFAIAGAEDFATGKINDPAKVGIRALDARTFRAQLIRPTPFFLDLCAFITLSVVPRQTIDKFGDRWLLSRPLPVSGAFELEEWRLNDKIRLRKNPQYWDAARTRCSVIDLLPCTSPATALNLYETGAADIVWDKELVPIDLIDQLQKRPDFHTFAYLGTYFFRFNVTRKPFDDVRVRKAFALAIDKERIVRKITRAGERPASHYVPPGVADYQSPEGLGYDPEEARRLLAQAGYPGGRGFPAVEYMFNSAPTHEKIAVELQQMWQAQLGVRIELQQMEWKAYLAAQSRLEFDMSRSSWIGDYNDANTFLDMFMSDNGNNRTGWKNSAYDQWVRRANSSSNAAARERCFQRAERLLIRDDLPIVPLFFYVGLEYYDGRKICGVYPNPLANHPLRAIGRRAPKINGRAAPPRCPNERKAAE